MKKFKLKIFLICTIIFGLLTFVSFIAAAAEDEGTRGTGIISFAFYKLFYVLRFPTHTLFWELIVSGSPATFYGGLVVNSFLYGLLAERLVYFAKANFQTTTRN